MISSEVDERDLYFSRDDVDIIRSLDVDAQIITMTRTELSAQLMDFGTTCPYGKMLCFYTKVTLLSSGSRCGVNPITSV